MSTITNNGIIIGRASMFYLPLKRLMLIPESKELMTSVGYSIVSRLENNQSAYLVLTNIDDQDNKDLEEKIDFLIRNREFELPLGVSVDNIADAVILKNDIDNLIQKYDEFSKSDKNDQEDAYYLSRESDYLITRLNRLLEINFEHDKVL